MSCYIFVIKHRLSELEIYSNLRFFFFKQKTAYEVRISDWSSDVCSSDLAVDEIVDVAERAGLGAVAVDRDRLAAQRLHDEVREIGRASCRERVCQYV